MIEEIFDGYTNVVSIREVTSLLQHKFCLKLSIRQVRYFMKQKMDFRWKHVSQLQPYVNTAKNISSRMIWAKRLISALEDGRVMVSIDECGYHDSYPVRKGWARKGRRIWRS